MSYKGRCEQDKPDPDPPVYEPPPPPPPTECDDPKYPDCEEPDEPVCEDPPPACDPKDEDCDPPPPPPPCEEPPCEEPEYPGPETPDCPTPPDNEECKDMKPKDHDSKGSLINNINIANVTDSLNIKDSFNNILSGNLSNNSVLNEADILSGNAINIAPTLDLGNFATVQNAGDILPINVLSENLASPITTNVLSDALDVSEVSTVINDVANLDAGPVTAAISGVTAAVQNIDLVNALNGNPTAVLKDTLNVDVANDLVDAVSSIVATDVGGDIVSTIAESVGVDIGDKLAQALVGVDASDLVSTEALNVATGIVGVDIVDKFVATDLVNTVADIDLGALQKLDVTGVAAKVTDLDVANLVANLSSNDFSAASALLETVDLTDVGAIVGSSVGGDLVSLASLEGLLQNVDLFDIPAFASDDA